MQKQENAQEITELTHNVQKLSEKTRNIVYDYLFGSGKEITKELQRYDISWIIDDAFDTCELCETTVLCAKFTHGYKDLFRETYVWCVGCNDNMQCLKCPPTLGGSPFV